MMHVLNLQAELNEDRHPEDGELLARYVSLYLNGIEIAKILVDPDDPIEPYDTDGIIHYIKRWWVGRPTAAPNYHGPSAEHPLV